MLMWLNLFLPVFMFICGCMMFIMNRKHLLIMLLSLEFIVLSLFLFIFIYLKMFNYELYFSMMFLTFSVCEGSLGLAILVSMIRTHGNNYFQSLNILLC